MVDVMSREQALGRFWIAKGTVCVVIAAIDLDHGRYALSALFFAGAVALIVWGRWMSRQPPR